MDLSFTDAAIPSIDEGAQKLISQGWERKAAIAEVISVAEGVQVSSQLSFWGTRRQCRAIRYALESYCLTNSISCLVTEVSGGIFQKVYRLDALGNVFQLDCLNDYFYKIIDSYRVSYS